MKKASKEDIERKKELEKRIEAIRKERKIKKRKIEETAKNILFWQTIMILLISNIFFSVILVPVLLIMKGWLAGTIIGLMGLLFGLIFNHLIKDIQGLGKHHRFFAGISVPSVAVIDLFLIIAITNKISPVLGLEQRADAFILSMIFIILFMLPYLIEKIKS